MLRIFALCMLALAVAQAATTTTAKPNHHHGGTGTGTGTVEHAEKDSLMFFYDNHAHQMVVVKGHDCYIFTMTDAERVSVHTDDGMLAIEVRLLGLLGTSTKTTVDLHSQNKATQHTCQHAHTVYSIA